MQCEERLRAELPAALEAQRRLEALGQHGVAFRVRVAAVREQLRVGHVDAAHAVEDVQRTVARRVRGGDCRPRRRRGHIRVMKWRSAQACCTR